MKRIIGYYDIYGYEVFSVDESKMQLLYFAGNSPHDNFQGVPVERGLDLETIKGYCEYTCCEIASEIEIPYAGIQESEHDYE